MYYNTTHEKGQILAEYERKAISQDEALYRIFCMYGTVNPSAIERITGWPRSSISRSLNTLTKDGRIEKTEKKMKGKYGRPEHIWKLV